MATNESIDSIIEQIETLIDSAWAVPFSGGRILVKGKELQDLLDDLKTRIPEDITKAKEIVADRQYILEEAKKESEMTVRVAQERAKKMVDHDEIVRQAQAKANEIMSTSQLQARELKRATGEYVDSVLRSTEEQMTKSVNELRAKRQAIKSAKIG